MQPQSGRFFVSDRNVKREASFAFFVRGFRWFFGPLLFLRRQLAAHSKNHGEDSYRYVEFITASVNSSMVDGWYPKGESSSTRSSRPPRAAVWKNFLVSLFTVARQQRYSSAFPARGKRDPRRRRRPPPRSMPLPERKEHRAKSEAKRS